MYPARARRALPVPRLAVRQSAASGQLQRNSGAFWHGRLPHLPARGRQALEGNAGYRRIQEEKGYVIVEGDRVLAVCVAWVHDCFLGQERGVHWGGVSE